MLVIIIVSVFVTLKFITVVIYIVFSNKFSYKAPASVTDAGLERCKCGGLSHRRNLWAS